MRKTFLIAASVALLAHRAVLYSQELEPKEKATLGAESRPILCTAMSPAGKTLAFGSQDGTVTIWDVATAKEKLTFKAHREPVLSLAFSADGKSLATGTNGKVKENTVRVWDVETGEPRTMRDATSGEQREIISPHMAEVYCLAFSPDGGILAVGGLNRVVGIFDLKKGEHRAWLKGHDGVIRSLAFAADGRTLISRSEDGIVKVWDVPTDQ